MFRKFAALAICIALLMFWGGLFRFAPASAEDNWVPTEEECRAVPDQATEEACTVLASMCEADGGGDYCGDHVWNDCCWDASFGWSAQGYCWNMNYNR